MNEEQGTGASCFFSHEIELLNVRILTVKLNFLNIKKGGNLTQNVLAPKNHLILF